MSKFILLSQEYDFGNSFQKLNVNTYQLYYDGTLNDFRDATGLGYIFLGDCINPENNVYSPFDSIENEPKGNYYLFWVNSDNISVKSSGFGMLPVFYQQQENIVASNVQLIADQSKTKKTFDKKWLVNQLLFNYQFGAATIFEEIKLLPAFTVLTIENGKFSLNKTTVISNYFSDKPLKWQKELEPLSNKFINICEQYFPDEEFTISFTGGFDGRTLVSVATSLKKSFKTFSYGRKNNYDVIIPRRNAEKLNIPYLWVPLEQEYVEKHYRQSAINFIKQTNGGNGFLYAHVNHASRQITNQGKYSISGIAGSELFRALHISSAVTSPALIQLFKSNTFEEFRSFVRNSKVFKYLDFKTFESAIEEVAFECWQYRSNLPKHLTRNQQLYEFVFEDIFRKFFGSWLLAQSDDLIVRTPFLDFEFFKALLKSDLAGVYSDFMTENPLKRYKGQVFYSEVICRTSKKLFWQKTGKGYPPAFVRYAVLRPLLSLPFLLKRIIRNINKPNLDNLSIISGLKVAWKLDRLHVNDQIFRSDNLLSAIENLNSTTSEHERDIILSSLSISFYSNKMQT